MSLNSRTEAVEPKHLQQSVNNRAAVGASELKKTFRGQTPVPDELLRDRIKENERPCQAGAASFFAPMKS
jgi:hypothetical protein